MKSGDVGNEDPGEFGGLGARNEATHLGHSIDEHEDRVHPAWDRQIH